MEHNLNIYQIAIRYTLCLFCGMIGGLIHDSNTVLGYILLSFAVLFFLEGILAFDPLMLILGKNKAKDAKKDFN